VSKPKVNFGFTITNRDVALGLATPADLVRQAQDAEASGAFAHIWVGDSIMVGPRLESITLLAAIAAKTTRVRIGVACMATLPSRQPLVFAYQWASLDLLSGSRSILIACLGQNTRRPDLAAEEYANMGITSRDRAARLEENLTIIRRLWTEDRVTFEGRFHRLLNASVEPKPAVPPPVWLVATPPLSGGKAHLAERALRRVARYGDGWVTTAWSKEDLGEMYRRLRDYAQEEGRPFDGKPVCHYYAINIQDSREAAYQEAKRWFDQYYRANMPEAYVRGSVALGTPQDCYEDITGYVGQGATEVLLRFPSWDPGKQFRRFVDEVRPMFA